MSHTTTLDLVFAHGANQLTDAAHTVHAALAHLPDPATRPMTAEQLINDADAITDLARALELLANSVRWSTLSLVTHLPRHADLRAQNASLGTESLARLGNTTRRALHLATSTYYALNDTHQSAGQLARSRPAQ